MAIGLGTPRPTIRLQYDENKEARLVEPKSEQDLTDKMRDKAKEYCSELMDREIYGYILKSKSPSCGMERMKIYKEHGIRPDNNGVGVFAEELMREFPNLPIEEDGRLMDPHLRENWVSRVFAYYDFKTNCEKEPSIAKLVKFHSRYKYKVLAHCQNSYKELGPIVANAKEDLKEVLEEYGALLGGYEKSSNRKRIHKRIRTHSEDFSKNAARQR